MKSGRSIQIFLAVTIAALVASGLYTSSMIRERQKSLESIFRYNVAYTASQAVIEYGRLHKALLIFDRNRTPDKLAEVKLRFEILYNRASIFDDGEFSLFVRQDSRRAAVVADLKNALARLDPVISPASVELNVAEALAVLEPLESAMIGLSSAANRYGADLVARDHRDLLLLHQRFSTLTFGLIICGLAVVILLIWNNRLLARAHGRLSFTSADLQRVAADLASANEAVAAANQELRDQNNLLKENKRKLRAQFGLFNAALNNMSQGLCMFDDDMRAIVFNQQFERLFSVSCETGSDSILDQGCRPSLADMAPDLAEELRANIRRNEASTFETECADGRIIAVAQRPMPQGDWVATFEDVTEQRRAQERIAHMARHDGLTNLPNRYAFRERIQEAMAEAAASGTMVAVMCLDLDHFKEVNDTLGHPTGDALLCAAAERLLGCIRDTDMVARFGGDEFAVLQSSIQRIDEAERLAVRLVEAMRQPFTVNGEVVYATGSLGLAISPRDGDDPDVLLKNADLALYAAKGDGRRTYRFFESEMDERLARRHSMERDLRLALAKGQFDLHFQPVVHLRTMKITGLEALLRWTHPVRGMVPPSTFVPIAEEAGLISEIGRWVMARACAEAARWPDDLKVAVNLSAAQFANGDIVDDVKQCLRDSGLPAQRLVVEITESLLLSENKGTLDTLHRLKALGIDIAMDDFGTGYSSLSYIRKYPFDRIKIDRAFVSSASRGETSAAIIQTIVHLGRSLGMTTVAEGVETQRDLDVLLASGCDEGQGYLFSRPVPRDSVLDMLAAHERGISKVA